MSYLPIPVHHRLRCQHPWFRRQWVPLVAEMTVGKVLTKIQGRQSHTERDSEGEQVERAVGRASCDEELRRGWQSGSGGEGRWPGRAGRSESARGDWEAVRRCSGGCQDDKTVGRTRCEMQTSVEKLGECQTVLSGQYWFSWSMTALEIRLGLSTAL